MLVLSLLSPFYTLKDPNWEMVLPTNLIDLPTAVNVIETIPYRHAQP